MMQVDSKPTDQVDKVADTAFLITILGKAIGGFFEFATAVLIMLVDIATLQRVLSPLSHLGVQVEHEITGQTKFFGIIYLGSRGIIRMVLAVALLKEWLWAYPVAMLLLASAIGYQLWLMIDHYSTGLLLLTLFDFIIVGLTMYEYRKLRRGGHLRRPHLPINRADT